MNTKWPKIYILIYEMFIKCNSITNIEIMVFIKIVFSYEQIWMLENFFLKKWKIQTLNLLISSIKFISSFYKYSIINIEIIVFITRIY